MKYKKIIVMLLFLIAIIIRIYQWPNTINDINCDEAMTALNAKSISETGKDMYGTTFPVYFESWRIGGQSALLTYLMAISIKIFGFKLFAIRLPTLIISLISIFVFERFIKEIFKGSKTYMIILFLLAINPWHIMQSWWALDCNLFPHFMLISIYLIYKSLKNNNIVRLYLAMLSFGITMYSYGIAFYSVPLILIFVMLYAVKNNYLKWKHVIISAIIFTVISMPLILMTIINLFKLNTINIGFITIQNFEYFIRTNDMLIFSNNIANVLITNITTLTRILLLNYDGLIWNAIPYIGTIYVGSFLFALISIIYLSKVKIYTSNEDKLGIKIVVIWFIVSLIIGILINDININRLNIIWYPVIILIGYGIYLFWKSFYFKKSVIILIATIYTILFICFSIKFNTYYNKVICNSWTFSQGYIESIGNSQNLDSILTKNLISDDKKIIFWLYASNHNFKNEFINKDLLIDYYYNNSTEKIKNLISSNNDYFN